MGGVSRLRSHLRVGCLIALALALAIGPAAAGAQRSPHTNAAARAAKRRCRVVRRHGRRVCARPGAASRTRRPAPTPRRTTTSAPAPHPSAAVAPPAQLAPTQPALPTSPQPAPPTPPQAPPPPSGDLRWAPPALVDPTTITLGTGYTHTVLSPTRDYVVKLPPTQKVGGTFVEGGHNVVLIGGSVTIPYAAPGAATSAERTAIYIKGATGTVHVEGVLIDGSGGGQFDGVDIAAPQATVQLENLRIVGVNGGLSSWHADVVQPWGGVRDLRIDHLSGASDYQGLMLSEDLGPIGSAEISNVDLTATTDATVDHGGHMLLLSKDTPACTTYPVSLTSFYVQPRPGRTVANSVWPAAITSLCDGLTGTVQQGPPPSGGFVPPGIAGVGYATTGYVP